MFSTAVDMLKYNAKLLVKANVLAGLAYACLLPIIFSFELLRSWEVARISELYMSLLGMIILTPLAAVDLENGIFELIAVKRWKRGWTFCFRLLIGILLLLIVTVGLLIFMRLRGSSFPFGRFLAGALVTQLFLGLIGISVTHITGNATLGYMFAFSYFFAEWVTKGKYTGDFFLFSLLRGNFLPKYYLLGIIGILLVFNLLLLNRRTSLLKDFT